MSASWHPAQELEIIVGTPPGGGQDRPARALMRVLDSRGLVRVPMRLTNIPGKGGGKAWDALRARRGDPHVLSISSAPLITNKLLGVTGYDHATLTPIATLYTEYLAFVARADAPLRRGGEFLERLRADPGALTIAIATAIGTTNHIGLGQIVQYLGGDPRRLKLRVFESALHAVADVQEGNADVAVVSAASAVKGVESGSLRAFAVSAPARLSGCYGDVPTWKEQSVPCVLGQWRGMIAPPDVNDEVIAFWEEVLSQAVESPEWSSELSQQHWTGTWKGSADTRRFLDSERDFLQKVLRDLGLMT
jgi:putative tricarboxylic transport membrane protein